MTELANVFTPSSLNLVFMVGVAGIGGFMLGFIIKYGIIAKYKKKVLNLEDEMLANHSRILQLEQQAASLREEKAKLSASISVPKVELKVS
ncbi:hypothetical protein BH10BAC2_BH10BAC2_00980 [soil metagenome]